MKGRGSKNKKIRKVEREGQRMNGEDIICNCLHSGQTKQC
jgi:hypothetical protein